MHANHIVWRPEGHDVENRAGDGGFGGWVVGERSALRPNGGGTTDPQDEDEGLECFQSMIVRRARPMPTCVGYSGGNFSEGRSIRQWFRAFSPSLRNFSRSDVDWPAAGFETAHRIGAQVDAAERRSTLRW